MRRLVLVYINDLLMSSPTEYKVLRSPEVHIYGVEQRQKREAPGDPVDDNLLSVRGKLVDDGAQ